MKFLKIFSIILTISLILYILNSFTFELTKIYFYYFILSFVIAFLVLRTNYNKKIVNFIEKNSWKFLIIIIFFTILILYRAGLFSEGPVILQDYPIQYFAEWYPTTVLLPTFNNVNGICMNYQLGYNPFYDHPRGPPLLAATLYNLFFGKFPFWVIFRFIVGIAFILPILAIYFFTKKLGFSPIVSLLSCILWLSWFHGYFLDGTFITYFAISFAIFTLYFYVDYSETKNFNSILLTSLFFSLTLLFQSMIFPALFICFLIYTLINRKKIEYKSILIILLIVFLIGLTYFISVYNGREYIESIFSKQPQVFTHQYDMNYIFWKSFYKESNFIFIFTLPLIILPFKRLNKHLLFLLLLAFSLIFIVFIINFIQINFQQTQSPILGFFETLINAFLVEKTVFFTKAFFGILSAYTVYLSFKLLNRKKFYNYMILCFIMASLVLFVFSYFNYLWGAWYKSDDTHFGLIYYNYTLEQWYSLKFENGVFSYSPKKDVLELFNFLKQNTTNDARILSEDSRYGKLGGNIMAMSAYYTGRFFVGGLHAGIMLPGDTWAVDGIFFGKNITEYKIDDLKEKLDEYNVGWISAWTPVAKEYFDSYPQNFKFIEETSSGFFKIYSYLNSPQSYFITKNNKTTIDLINITNSTISFKIENGKINDEIILKFRYEEEWHAYANDKEIPIKPNGILMSINLPSSGDYIIKLEYKENLLVKIGKYVSFFSFISLVFSIFYLKFKKNIFNKSSSSPKSFRVK
jgi:hypothetical protein